MHAPEKKNVSFLHNPVILCMSCGLILLLVTLLFARAGGAGGGGGGGGNGGGGDLEIIFRLIYWILVSRSIPWPLKIVLIGAIGSGGYLYYKHKERIKLLMRTLGNLETPGPLEVLKENGSPGSDTDVLLKKADYAFRAIQQAWAQQDLSGVRRFISDGVFQRFNTQFVMMRLLKQRNEISDVTIKRMSVVWMEKDGEYDIAHVRITARMKDRFVCGMNPSLNKNSNDHFTEYWSFIRKTGADEKDLYQNNNCPGCGAQISDDVGETVQCNYCGTTINSGEYDWVLSEITQADDYAGKMAVDRIPAYGKNIASIRKRLPDFSLQQVEDKVSNGYLQIQTAQSLGEPERSRRFVSEKVLGKLRQKVRNGTYAYNRLFLNDVTTIGAAINESIIELHVAVTETTQLVCITSDGRAELVDPVPDTSRVIAVIRRDADMTKRKGSLYAHQCPSCGASLGDTTENKCGYCNTIINSTANDWIITELLSMSEYKAYCKQHDPGKPKVITGIVAVEELYNVREYAFNNLMVIIGADRVFTPEELELAGKVARKFGFKPSVSESLFRMAVEGRLSIRMPEDQKKIRKIIRLMEHAAMADGTVSPEEKKLLDSVAGTYRKAA